MGSLQTVVGPASDLVTTLSDLVATLSDLVTTSSDFVTTSSDFVTTSSVFVNLLQLPRTKLRRGGRCVHCTDHNYAAQRYSPTKTTFPEHRTAPFNYLEHPFPNKKKTPYL